MLIWINDELGQGTAAMHMWLSATTFHVGAELVSGLIGAAVAGGIGGFIVGQVAIYVAPRLYYAHLLAGSRRRSALAFLSEHGTVSRNRRIAPSLSTDAVRFLRCRSLPPMTAIGRDCEFAVDLDNCPSA